MTDIVMMNLTGKVMAVNPGRVFWEYGAYCYSIVISYKHDTFAEQGINTFTSAAAAKQAMREEVAWQRKKHCCNGFPNPL